MCKTLLLHPQYILSVCAFFFFPQLHLHHQLIHIFQFTSLYALLIQFNLEVILQLSLVCEWDSSWRTYLLFFFFFYKDILNWQCFLSFRRAAHVKELSDLQLFLQKASECAEGNLWPLYIKSVCRAVLWSARWTVVSWSSVLWWLNLAYAALIASTVLQSWECNVSSASDGPDLCKQPTKNLGHQFHFSALGASCLSSFQHQRSQWRNKHFVTWSGEMSRRVGLLDESSWNLVQISMEPRRRILTFLVIPWLSLYRHRMDLPWKFVQTFMSTSGLIAVPLVI